jgi:uncharacterized membrane protein YbhN (UPF0104 family)
MHQKQRRFNVSLWPGGRPVPVRLLVTLLVTVALLALLLQAPWPQILAALLAANPLWLALAVLISATVFPLWVVQWQTLAGGRNAVALARMAEVVALSALANATLFKVAGLASAGALLVGRAGLSAAAAVSVLTLDQVLAGLAKVLVLGLAVMLVPLPAVAVQTMLGFSGLVLGLAAIVVLLACRPGMTAALAATRWPAIARAGDFLGRVSASLAVLRSPDRAGLVVLLAVAKKTAEVMAAYGVQLACGIDASPAAAVLVVAAVGLVTVLPIVPGNLGVFTAGVYAAYRFLGIDPSPALAAGLLLHAVEFLPTLIFGYGALLAGRRTARRASSPQPP